MIRLTNSNNAVLYVNPDHIVFVQDAFSKSYMSLVYLTREDIDYVAVKEPAEAIAAAIAETR